jgi:histone acetyltransferase (RNA polymerase elongator complex component)
MRNKGRELLKQIARYAISQSKQLSVISIVDAEAYYKKLGFVPEKNVPNKFTIDPQKLV